MRSTASALSVWCASAATSPRLPRLNPPPMPGSLAPPLLAAEATAPAGTLALLDGSGQMRALEDIEAEAIRFAITHYGGRMSEVARRLHIGRSTLYRKLDSLGRDAAISDPKTAAWYSR